MALICQKAHIPSPPSARRPEGVLGLCLALLLALLLALALQPGTLAAAVPDSAPVQAAQRPAETGQTGDAALDEAASLKPEAGMAPDLLPESALGEARLRAAMLTAIGEGRIDPDARAGFLGIPGGPTISLPMAFFWSLWVGWLFSSIGAFGGIMATVGHISLYGLGDYAASFGISSPMNRLLTDSVRVTNQCMIVCSALIASLRYGLLGRIVLPLGIALGIGSLTGSILASLVTQGKVTFREYVGWFGLFVFLLGLRLLWQTMPWARAGRERAEKAARYFEARASRHASGRVRVKLLSVDFARVRIASCGVTFSFPTLLPVLGGFAISAVSAFLGIGGGFLFVPLLANAMRLPMFLAAGTSAFTILIGTASSVTTFMFTGTAIDWPLAGTELAGVAIGSWIGPATSRFIPDLWLRRLFIVVCLFAGICYILRGFYGLRLW